MTTVFLNAAGKLRNGWWIALFFLALAAMVVPVTVVAASRGAVVPIPWQLLMVLIASILCVKLRRETVSSLAGPLAAWPRGVAVGLAAGLSTWTGAAAILWATGSVTWQLNPEVVTALAAGVGVTLAVCATEELLFRGFVFHRLIDGVGEWPAQLLMAAYFLLLHLDNPGMTGMVKAIAALNIFLAGLMFGAAWLRTRSLALPIALHFALNFTQGNVLGFGVSGFAQQGAWVPRLGEAPQWWTGGAFGLEASVPGTAAILVALVVLYRWPRRRDRRD